PPKRIVRKPTGESLAGEVRRPAERIADADVAVLVDRRTGHPAIELIGRVGALLPQRYRAIASTNLQLVPPHAAATGRRVDRVHGDERFAVAEIAINRPRHDLVALRVELSLGAWLRHAIGELSVTQVVIRRDGD